LNLSGYKLEAKLKQKKKENEKEPTQT